MGGKSAILSIKILTDATKAQKGLDDASTRDGQSSSLPRWARPSSPRPRSPGRSWLLGKAAADSASAQQQPMGALDSGVRQIGLTS